MNLPDLSPVRLLIGLRGGIGAGALLAPGLAVRMLGLNPGEQMAFLARIIGIRDLAIALGTAAAGEENQRLWLSLGVLCDATDGTAGLIAHRHGAISQLSTALVSAPAILGCGLGLAALRRHA
ncbi:MAG: hypothetical protein JOZ73_00705 [Solirubrobacterales bacterium]|nr:hypothetical protein [Solirubrobacterales bacterium]